MRIYSTLISKKYMFFIPAIAFLVIFSFFMFANEAGRTGKTSTTSSGCGGNSCHGLSANTTTVLTVTSSTGSFTVAPGSITSFTITVSNSNSLLTYAGINIGVKTDSTGNTNVGTLAVIAGDSLRRSAGELTQTGVKYLNNGSASYTFNWTAPTTQGTYYMRAVGIAVKRDSTADSNDLWNWMPIQPITVFSSNYILLTSPKGGESWCRNSSHNITWLSAGMTNVKIDLSNDGGTTFPTTLVASTPASDSSWAWNIPADQDTGSHYKIRVSDASNSSVSATCPSNFTIPGPPVISVQPVSIDTCTGNMLSFSVTASGGTLTYAWRKNGTPITGGFQSRYTIFSAKITDTGTYDCIIKNACGDSIICNPATLTLDISPTIVTQPASVGACLGDSAVLTVNAVGTDINYAWYKDSLLINGATSPSYKILHVTLADTGSYHVVVNGKCNVPKTSLTVKITLNSTPAITQQPVDTTVNEGSSLNLTIAATGGTLKYQWYKDGVAITGQTTATLRLTAIAQKDAGKYQCVVSNSCGSDSTVEAKVTVNKPNGPFLTLSLNRVTFDSTLVNTFRDTIVQSTILNDGNQDLIITDIHISGRDSSVFSIINPPVPVTIPAGISQSLSIHFNPISNGNKIGTVNFINNSTQNPTIALNGFAGIIKITSTSDTLIFNATDNINPIVDSVNISNSGTVPAYLKLNISGTDASNFTLIQPTTSEFKLSAGRIQKVKVSFLSTGKSTALAILNVASIQDTTQKVINLVGNLLTDVKDENQILQNINVYPNPTSSELDISYNLIQTSSLTIQITDMLGKIYYNYKSVQNPSGSNILHLNTNDLNGNFLNDGYYTIIFKTDKEIFTIPLIIIK